MTILCQDNYSLKYFFKERSDNVEQWTPIYNGLYSVSNLGNVKANARDIETKTGVRHYKEKILKPEMTQDGHLRIVLSEAGKRKRVFVHRLVAEAFIPNPDNLPIINHKDENPSNNEVSNLEWCTVLYNNNYNERNKRIGDKEGHNVCVYDKDNNYIDSFPSITKVAKTYNLSLTTLWRGLQDGRMINNYYFKEEL